MYDRALQFHPTSSTLYLLQAYFHLHPNSPFPQSILPDSTKDLSLSEDSDESDKPPAFAIEGVNPARTALLLGLRLVPTSPEIWTEYIKLELGWVEALRRRWKLLGIKDAFADKPVPERAESFEGDEDALRGGEGAFGPEGEDARKSILAGQLVIHALTSALKAIEPAEVIEGRKNGGMRFRERLLALFRGYPSPLRAKCLEVVHEELRSISIGDSSDRQVACNARLLGISRRLFERPYDESEEPVMEGECALSGVDLVEEYGKIAKDIRKITKGSKDPMWIETAGQWLIERINCHQDYPELVNISCF